MVRVTSISLAGTETCRPTIHIMIPNFVVVERNETRVGSDTEEGALIDGSSSALSPIGGKVWLTD